MTKSAQKGARQSASPSPPPPAILKAQRKANKAKTPSSTWLTYSIMAVLAIVMPIGFAYVAQHVHQVYIVLPSRVRTPSPLPRVFDESHYSAKTSSDMFWGTYRSQLYFGVRARTPDSPLIGLMWYEQKQTKELQMPKIRHWCDQGDGLDRYGWTRHDGRTFGSQEILEKDGMTIRTDFIKRGGGTHGGDWTARVTAENAALPVKPADGEKIRSIYSFIVYVALPDGSAKESFLKPHIVKDEKTGVSYISSIDGFTSSTKHFTIRFDVDKDRPVVARSYLMTKMEKVDLTGMHNLMMTGMGVIATPPASSLVRYLGLTGVVPSGSPIPDRPNVLAVQFTAYRSTSFEIVYEVKDNPQRVKSLAGVTFDKELQKKIKEFDAKFESTFGLSQKGLPDMMVESAQAALSNMLGSIGYWHGYNKVKSVYTKVPVAYGPHHLFATVPSRPFFPRGFLWDEGFHQLLISKFDAPLSLEIFGSWLDLMNVDGWIPREQILGVEAEAKVPAEYIVQDESVANPPMFFYLLSKLLLNDEFVAEHKPILKRMYPRIRVWYSWLNESQAGEAPGTYRWRGRNATTNLELNPKTLASGLDDYPRASNPTDDEYHVDLYCWMRTATKVMLTLAKTVDAPEAEISDLTATLDTQMSGVLDDMHWSEKTGRYADFGLHTKNVKLVRPAPPRDSNGRPLAEMPMVRVQTTEPTRRLVTDTFGYISLFPLMLRHIPADSPKLGKLIAQIMDKELLWTEFGLRSLARTSPLYAKRNTEHDPPYWRGNIWMNMNYLVLSALRYYADASDTHSESSFNAYTKLRAALVQNVLKEHRRTGYLWEHYDADTGEGHGTHPFTGWTSLVTLIMAESYD